VIKTALGITAILLTFAGYIPYVRDIIRKRTHPHTYSWFMWATTSLIIFGLQLKGGAGTGAFVTLAAVIVTYFIFGLALKYGKSDITRMDTFFLMLAIIAASLWLLAKQPMLSVILLTVAETLAFIPTIRKSWNKPYDETLSSYGLNALRFILALVALGHYNLLTTLYPAAWALSNGSFWILLVARRQVIPAPQAHHPPAHTEPSISL
jgi:hypothetical protein